MVRVQLIHEYDPTQYSMANEVLLAAHPIVYQDFEMILHRPTVIPMQQKRKEKKQCPHSYIIVHEFWFLFRFNFISNYLYLCILRTKIFDILVNIIYNNWRNI